MNEQKGNLKTLRSNKHINKLIYLVEQHDAKLTMYMENINQKLENAKI